MIRNRYSIAEAAELVGIGPWTLRRLERAGHVPSARRDPLCGYRVYTHDEVEHIRQAIERIVEEATMRDARVPA